MTKVLKDGTHSDVGPNFPWDYFAKKVAEYSGEKPEPEKPPVLSDRQLLEASWANVQTLCEGRAGHG